MKYCEDYAALLDLFVDGELPPDEMGRVQAHLEDCPGCQAYVDDALAIRAGFPDAEDTFVPEGFAGSVMERIREDERKSAAARRRSVRHWTETLAVLAACCALVILVKTNGFEGGAPAMTTARDLQGESESSAVFGADAPGGDMEPAEDCGAGGDMEYGIAPQMEPEKEMESVEHTADGAEASRTGTTAGKKDDFEAGGTTGSVADGEEGYGTRAAFSPALAEDALESVDSAGKDVLYLTAGEAGDFLNEAALVWEGAGERHYELNAGEFQALLEALGREEELPEIEKAAFLVIVVE